MAWVEGMYLESFEKKKDTYSKIFRQTEFSKAELLPLGRIIHLRGVWNDPTTVRAQSKTFTSSSVAGSSSPGSMIFIQNS